MGADLARTPQGSYPFRELESWRLRQGKQAHHVTAGRGVRWPVGQHVLGLSAPSCGAPWQDLGVSSVEVRGMHGPRGCPQVSVCAQGLRQRQRWTWESRCPSPAPDGWSELGVGKEDVPKSKVAARQSRPWLPTAAHLAGSRPPLPVPPALAFPSSFSGSVGRSFLSFCYGAGPSEKRRQCEDPLQAPVLGIK